MPRQHASSPVRLLGHLATLLGVLLTTAQLRAQPLVVAQISDRPKQDYAHLRPMARYAAEQLTEFGFDSAEVRLYRNIDDLILAVRSGEVHWVSETPYTAARLMDETGSLPLVKKLKNGQREYQTLIYAHQDSNVKELEDLIDHSIAFEHPFSFTGYYLPKRILESGGYTLTSLESPEESPPKGQVGYLFSRNEKNNALWVDKGIVSAGVLNDGDWENPERVPPRLRKRLRVIYRSSYYPRAFEVVTPALSLQAAEQLQRILLTLDRPTHGALLDRYENTEKFAPIQPEDLQLLAEIAADRSTPQ